MVFSLHLHKHKTRIILDQQIAFPPLFSFISSQFKNLIKEETTIENVSSK